VTLLTASFGAKRVGLLRELIPKADLMAVLVNTTSESQVKDVQDAARKAGLFLYKSDSGSMKDR
jgi:ABC-type uncharacterized transport system substrate-binding protein